jgi:hypothetical protein
MEHLEKFGESFHHGTLGKVWGIVPCVYKIYTVGLFQGLLEILRVAGEVRGILTRSRQSSVSGVLCKVHRMVDFF